MCLASFNGVENSMTWLGVGNIEGLLLRRSPSLNPSQESLLMRAGVVGYQIPSIRSNIVSLSPGDQLIFATDGIHSGFAERVATNESPQPLADRILQQHFKGNDDALVLVVRYLGTDHE